MEMAAITSVAITILSTALVQFGGKLDAQRRRGSRSYRLSSMYAENASARPPRPWIGNSKLIFSFFLFGIINHQFRNMQCFSKSIDL